MAAQFCPKCGAMLSPGVSKCPQCGTALGAASASPDDVSRQEFWALARTVLVPILALVLGFIVLIVLVVVIVT